MKGVGGYCKNDNAGKYIAQFVMALLVVRWASIAFSTLAGDWANFTKILPESAIMWVLILLLWLGTRRKDKKREHQSHHPQ